MNFTRIRSWGEFSNKLYHLFVPPSYVVTPTPQSEDSDWTFTERKESGGGIPSGSGSSGELDFDLNRVTRRVNYSFFSGWNGPPPFVSWYIVHLILIIGLLVAVLWLICAFCYYTMQKIRGWCPSFKCRRRRRPRTDEEDPLTEHRKNRELPTPEVLEQRRNERLAMLHKECDNLEEQLIAEKNTTISSRASDSDLEYLGYEGDTPPLKRNSISLQDIPQSVIKIRREKQLRQLKEEIEHLHALSQSQDLDKEPLPAKSPLLTDLKFDFPPSKSSSPSPVDVSAKTSSLQDIPRTALVAKRQEELLNISKEIEHMKNYKIHQKTILSTVLSEPEKDKKQRHQEKKEILAKLNRSQGSTSSFRDKSPSKSPLLKRQESEVSEVSSGKSFNFEPSASVKRTRQQELNRVRVELKELSYKLNLNYVFDVDRDRDKIVPKDWPKQCSFQREDSFGK